MAESITCGACLAKKGRLVAEKKGRKIILALRKKLEKRVEKN